MVLGKIRDSPSLLCEVFQIPSMKALTILISVSISGNLVYSSSTTTEESISTTTTTDSLTSTVSDSSTSTGLTEEVTTTEALPTSMDGAESVLGTSTTLVLSVIAFVIFN